MVIPAGFAQVNFIFDGAAVPEGAQVVIGVQNTAAPASAAAIASIAGGYWVADLMGGQATAIALRSVLCKLGPNSTGPSASVPFGNAGTDTSQALPGNTALLVRKNTAVGGRRGRGRMYIPGITEAESPGGGTVLSTFVTGMQTACATFLGHLSSASLPMVLLHSDATAPTLVTSLTVESVFGSQRDRMRR